MLPSLLAPGPPPMYRAISGAGLLAKGIITPRLFAREVMWKTRSHGGLLSWLHKFWGAWTKGWKDWLWGGQDMGMLRECSGACRRGCSPWCYPEMLGKDCWQVHSWFPHSLEENGSWAFPDTAKSALTSPGHACWVGWVERGWGFQNLLRQKPGWSWAHQFLLSCPVSSPTNWRGWAIRPLRSFLSQTFCDSEILCKPMELPWDVHLTLEAIMGSVGPTWPPSLGWCLRHDSIWFWKHI